MSVEKPNNKSEQGETKRTPKKIIGVPHGSERCALDYLRSGKPVPPELVPKEGNVTVSEQHDDSPGRLLFPDLKLPTLLD